MKKILFTSLLCASFAANVNLLPAPNSADETDGRRTGKQTVSVAQAPQDADCLQAQNAVGPLITDLQKSGLFKGGKNKDLAQIFWQKSEITSAEQILFPGSAFGELVKMDSLAEALRENKTKTDCFKQQAHDLAKNFGWDDTNTKNTNQSSIINELFALNKALGAKELNKDAVTSARFQLEEALKPVRDLWKALKKLVAAEQKLLAKGIVADMFTDLGSGLTTDEATLACNKLFEHSGGNIKEDSLSHALPESSKDPEAQALRQKLKKGPDGKNIRIKDIFPKFLDKTFETSKNRDLSRFSALTPHIDKKTFNARELVNIGYQGYALQEEQEAEAKVLQAEQEKLASDEKELQKKTKELAARREKLEKKSPAMQRK